MQMLHSPQKQFEKITSPSNEELNYKPVSLNLACSSHMFFKHLLQGLTPPSNNRGFSTLFPKNSF